MLATYGLFRKIGKPTVNHKNGKKNDNYIKNLEWMDTREQNSHARQTGLNNPAKGMECNNIYSEDLIHKICDCLQTGITKPKDISKKINYEYTRNFKQLVVDIKSKRNWKHISKDYTWGKKI